MKRFLVLIIFLAMAVILVPWLHPARAADQKVDVYEKQKLVKSVVFKIGVPYYVVAGQTPGVKMDVAPFVQNDRTFVPVRFLGNALGVDNSNIAWDDATQTATLKGVKAVLSMTIGKAQVVSNGQARAIDVAPLLVDPGRTMLPARFVAEGLGYEVAWDEASQTVVCWPQGQPKPDVKAAVDYLNKKQQEQAAWTWTESGYKLPDPKGPLVKEVWNNGVYWTKAGLEIDPESTLSYVGIDLLIMPPDYKGSWEAYDQAQEILASKFGDEFAGQVMDYVRQKKSWRDMVKTPPKAMYAPNGQEVLIKFGEGTQITVYLNH